MAELGKAYIEVRADLAKFPAELRAKLKTALAEATAGVDFKEFESKAEDAGGRAGSATGKKFGKKLEEETKKSAEKAGKGLLSKLIGFFDSHRSSGSGSLFGSISGAVSGGISDGLKQGQSAASTISEIGSKIGDIGGTVGSVVKVGAIALLIPIAIQLAGALVQMGAALFALPAVAGVAVAAIAPLVIAFQGMGEAISAGLSGDTEKFNAALKGLAPSAQKVAKEIVGLGPALKAIKSSVQQAFFAPLIGQFQKLGVLLLPALGKGLSVVAKQLGNFGAGLVDLLSSDDIVADLNQLFQSTARIIRQLSGPAIELFGNLFGIMEKGLPFVEKFFGGVAGGLTKAAGFLSKIQQNGQLQEWLGKAGDALKSVLKIGKELGQYLIGLLGGEVGDQGRDFLHKLGDEIQRMNEFLKSKDGQTAIHNLTTLLKAFGAVVLFFISKEPAMLKGFNDVFDAVRTVLHVLQELGGGFVGLIKIIGSFVGNVGKQIGRFFTETIPRWFDATVDFFKGLPARIANAFFAVKDLVVGIFLGLFDKLKATVLGGIGVVIGIFLASPQLLKGALDAVVNSITTSFFTALHFVTDLVRTSIDNVVEILRGLPGLASDAISAIGTFFTDFWTSTMIHIQTTVESGYNRVVGFFGSIPDRIRALGPKVAEAARSIGHRIGEALSDIGDFATDLGKKVFNALKGSINRAIDGINAGIALVDDKVPGGLPRIPKLAKGDIINRPTLAVIGEKGPEVVVPLTNAARAKELARESGLVDLLKLGRPSNGVQVVVYLDPSGVIIPTVRTVVDGALDDQGDELAYGTRSA